jgi:CHASE2 domain-containing sensor protein/tRNA A-37 threonylcarbamoyl transferase component Bud32
VSTAAKLPRSLALLIAGALAVGVGTVCSTQHLLRRPEEQTVDLRLAIRGPDRRKIAGIVLVDIDDATFNDFREKGLHARWPFPRRYHARVIDELRASGAKVIGYDVQFTEESTVSEDNALIEAAARAHGVVLSTTEVGPNGTTNVFGGDEVLRRIGARAANATVIPDSDGVFRRMRYSIDGLKTPGVVLAEAATGRSVSASRFGGASHMALIDFAGPPGTVPAISFSRVYEGRFPRDEFAGKIVIVGPSAPSFQDVHKSPTAGNGLMTGPELIANSAATVLAGIPLREPPGWVEVVLIVVLAMAAPLAGMRLGTLGVAFSGLATVAVWIAANQLAFNSGTVLDFSDPVAALLVATAGTVTIGMWADSRERRVLRLLFASGATPVVERVLRDRTSRSLEPTAIIGGYRIEEVIGQGSMGIVYRGTHLALERRVAIKLIAPERSKDPVFRERFISESRSAASIEHASVIPIYEAGEDDGLLFIAMRLVDGFDLGELLVREGVLQPDRAVALVEQVAGALDAAHARGLVHRDIKPANVLLSRDRPERAFLTDFGLAKRIGSGPTLTKVDRWVGTLDYVAPEQIEGAAVDGKADVYALAGVLYHCLTGQVPFPRDEEAAKLWAHINAPPPIPSTVASSVRSTFDVVIARGMAKDGAERFATAGQLARAAAGALAAVDDERAAVCRRPRVFE